MKERVSSLLLVVLLVVSLVGCGGQKSSMSYDGAADVMINGVSGGSGFQMDTVSAPEASYDESQKSADVKVDNVQEGASIQRDMLVYRGEITLTTKEYDASLKALFEMFDKYDCFIEESKEWTKYRHSDDTVLNVYDAVLRIRSTEYDEFMEGTSNVGVVESKSSSVENMNVEYSDTATALRIQEARLDRYLARLENETDSEVALQLEREITDIQIQVQQLKSRQALIETDVAYSYITLSLNEVKEYTSQISYKDPLHVRLWAEVVNTYYEFTDFLVGLLFFIIHASPYIVIIGVPLFIFRRKLPKVKLRGRKPKAKADDKPKE